MLSPVGKKVSVTLIADSRTIVPQRGILEIDRKIERKRECKRNTRLHSLKTPRGRLELPTFRLTAERSAIELTGIIFEWRETLSTSGYAILSCGTGICQGSLRNKHTFSRNYLNSETASDLFTVIGTLLNREETTSNGECCDLRMHKYV